MDNQKISSASFVMGWNKCRSWMCKKYNIDETKVLTDECINVECEINKHE